MGFRDAFIIRQVIVPPVEKGETKAAQAEPAASGQGVFLSGQSLFSFPGGERCSRLPVDARAALFAQRRRYCCRLSLDWRWDRDLSDRDLHPNVRPKTAFSWIISVAIAIPNSLFLAATVLGLAKDVFGLSPAGK